MKINNKFIALGLGISLSFAGTVMSYSWFYDNDLLNYRENIGILHIEENNGESVGKTDAKADDKKFEIDIYNSLKNILKYKNIKDMNIKDILLNGVFNEEYKKCYIDDDKDEIKIKYDNVDIEEKLKHWEFNDTEDYIKLKISYSIKDGKENKQITNEYKITFSRVEDKEDKFKAHWTLLESITMKSLVEDELEEENSVEQVDPPLTDDTVEDENNEAVTLPELGEDNNEESKEQVPEDVPQEDTTENKPTTMPIEGENQQ